VYFCLFPLCFSVFHYLFIRVMFATFCVYFVYDFYTNNNNNNKSWGQKGGVVLASQHGPSEAPKVKTI